MIYGSPSVDTLVLLRQLQVHVMNIRNPLGLKYKIGNKLACLEAAQRFCKDSGLKVDTVLFLDSDMLCVEGTGYWNAFDAHPEAVLLKPADYNTWGGSEGNLWAPLYRALGISEPLVRVMVWSVFVYSLIWDFVLGLQETSQGFVALCISSVLAIVKMRSLSCIGWCFCPMS